MASSWNQHIPEHLWCSIFILLPVKCLLLLRSVCKSWNQVISDHSFIESHLAHNKASSNPNKYLLLWNQRDPNPALDHDFPYLTTLVDSKTYSHVLESHAHDMRSMFGKDSAEHGLENYGICDGLVCLSLPQKVLKADSPIFLWNPVVKKGKKLPPIENEEKRPYVDTCYLCFGYHGGDYKVINVVPYLNTLYHVYVYSLSTDQWKKSRIAKNNIGSIFYGEYTIRPFPARLVNGCAYFLQYPKKNGIDQVVAVFDLRHEIMRQIDLPDADGYLFVKLEEYCEKTVAVMGKSLGSYMVMWVLRTGNDHSVSWDKKFTIEAENSSSHFSDMGFISMGKLVLKRFVKRKPFLAKYFLYDVENESELEYTAPMGLSDVVKNRASPRINGLTESLVLLNETTTPACTKMQPGSSYPYKKPRTQDYMCMV
ncbi:hypothetical protein DCAR_0521406 [Daucus carota subsp. sativus]|uniref:Uncharacterized protein n=1 Tax=Daucus carota subsp. sativus TaxID=79200 RepID=A0A164Z7G5_DAUCS|nr:PREDICTED: F-box protein CPR30-like [Daucus carota subsp. sativus]WOH02019.1 hypothetical protein DCAR_0521406 [Daucus carota subsp. sativus]